MRVVPLRNRGQRRFADIAPAQRQHRRGQRGALRAGKRVVDHRPGQRGHGLLELVREMDQTMAIGSKLSR